MQSDFPDSQFNFQLFSSWVDICQILGDISTCCMRRHISRTKKLYIVNSLCRWTRRLPSELRVSPNDQVPNTYFPNTHNFAARQLYLPYFISLIVLSRMQHSAGSVSLTATLAASFVARIFEDFLARDEIKVLAPIFTRYCLISSMALVSVMSHHQLWEASQPDLEILQLALTELSKRWRSAIGASKALKNVISKRQQRSYNSTVSVRMDDEHSLEYFGMIDLGYCRIWNTLSQQLSHTNVVAQEQLAMPIATLNDSNEPASFINPSEPLDMGLIQFEHVENWILNDEYLFEP